MSGFNVTSRGVRIGTGGGTRARAEGPTVTRMFVTINTNRMDNQLDIAQGLDRFLKDGFATPRAFAYYQDVGFVAGRSAASRVTIPPIDYNDTNQVLDVNVDGLVEIGDGRKPHMHVIVEIRHNTYVRFNRLRMKEWYVSWFEANAPGLDLHVRPKYPNIKIQLLGNVREGADLENYLNKGTAVDVARERAFAARLLADL